MGISDITNENIKKYKNYIFCTLYTKEPLIAVRGTKRACHFKYKNAITVDGFEESPIKAENYHEVLEKTFRNMQQMMANYGHDKCYQQNFDNVSQNKQIYLFGGRFVVHEDVLLTVNSSENYSENTEYYYVANDNTLHKIIYQIDQHMYKLK